jgi:uncharacterized protein YlxW (UPF0749 family)
MRRSISCLLWTASFLVAPPLAAQNVNTMNPQEIQSQHHATPEEIRDRVSNGQLQKDAKDLAELCAALQTDLNGVQKGLLSKDVIERLKRMEKLSKRVREQFTKTPLPSQ